MRFTNADDAKAVTIPLSALFQTDGKPAVWLVDDAATLRLRAIEIGRYPTRPPRFPPACGPVERIVVAGVPNWRPDRKSGSPSASDAIQHRSPPAQRRQP